MIDLNLFKNIMTEANNNPDLIDSYSPNQFKSKENLINHINSLNILNEDSEIVIFGSWYGSILIPAFHDKVKRITAIDLDEEVIGIAKNRLFKNYDKVTWITADIFEDYRDQYYSNCDLFINTSCEHMKPMREWGPSPKYKTPWWDRIKPNAHFAFQSNNMFDIPGHTNCVNHIGEFKLQLPDSAEILIEDEVKDERGTRFTLIGKL